ncbi:type II and III secretion system protein [Agaribacter marinus]|uniref:Type II secretion system protein n=1 Tax=Agaribacter marinus TaxID=1431249 RepID=A0AA37WKF9_9ALTE|nr:type II and III secretion system protein [Agaribacter marinus]GLR70880.1 type II secretion system protein [Agaribacter marinus]
MLMISKRIIAILAFSAVVVGCAQLKGPGYKLSQKDNETFTKPIRGPKSKIVQDDEAAIEVGEAEDKVQPTLFKNAPTLSVEQKAEVASDSILPKLNNQTKVSRLSFNNMPVSTFINEIFGNQLGLSFVIEPQVAEATDLVTMRLASPLTPNDLYRIATRTLAPYGVTTSLQDELLVFSYSEDASAEDTPLLISGRALPDVPPSNRPLFYVYPVKSVNANNVENYLRQLFKSSELNVVHDFVSNSIILKGQRLKVEQAIAATKLFDVPEMAGMYSRIVVPEISNVLELATNLQKILEAEGFFVAQNGNSGSPIRLLPLESTGQLIVFSKSKELLIHIEDWINTIEIKRQNEIEEGFFSYVVQSTLATHVVDVLGQLGVADYVAPNNDENETRDAPRNNSTTNSRANRRSENNNSSNSSDLGTYTVDEQSNTIFFRGSGKTWLDILPVIKRLDKPAPSVMIEAVLVEISLSDKEETGVQWLANSSIDKYNGSLRTNFPLENASNGFAFTLDSAGITRATINAFYQNDKANIRSRPRIMVKSGEEANFNALTRIPVVSSSVQSVETPDAPTVQNVTYLDTGVVLDIKPTVHASGFVDLEISQTLSQASTSVGAAGNPRIIERKVNTKVTLRDGGSVLIGGLISSSTSDGTQGIPLLGRLPIIGKLFSTDIEKQDRTELMIMIIPYVSNSPSESESLTDEFQLERIRALSIN